MSAPTPSPFGPDRSGEPGGTDGVCIEPYVRERHGDGPARVVEGVYREYGFTWEPLGYHFDVLFPEQAYAPPDHFFDVAVKDDEVVGTVGGALTDGVAELKRLYLSKSLRGLGVGRRLLDRFVDWARERGAARAILWSDKRFTDAHRLYERAGFRVTGDRICPGDPDNADEFGYARDL